MYFEIYVDSLFLLHFLLNLYMLILANRLLLQSASGKRVFVGAMLGAICAIVPIFSPIPVYMGRVLGVLLSVSIMSKYTFKVKGKKQVLKLLERMIYITIFFGGFMTVILKWWPFNSNGYRSFLGVSALSTMVFLLLDRRMRKKKEEKNECMVIIENESEDVKIEALLDTGNSLVEPISGKPVTVVSGAVLEKLTRGIMSEGFRMVPFRSVGKQKGVLKAYLVERMVVEVHGIRKECRKVWVAVSDEFIGENSRYQVILHPGIVEGEC